MAIEQAGDFFQRLREANAQAHLGDKVATKRAHLNDLVARLDNPQLGAAAAAATITGAGAAAVAAAAEGLPPNGPPPPPPPPPPSADELNVAEVDAADGSPPAAPLRLPPGMRPAWLFLSNLQLFYLRNQPLERIARQLLERAVAVPQATPPEAAATGGPPGPTAAAPAAPWARVLPLAAADLDSFGTLLERRLTSILTSRVHVLLGRFDTAQQMYDATFMAALSTEVRQVGVYVVVNTSEAAMCAQVSLLQDKLLAEPVLSTAMPVTRQDFEAERIWDCEPRFMPLRGILRAATASDGAAMYDMLPGGPPRQRVDAAVAAALRTAGLPPGFVLPWPLLDAAIAAAVRSLLLHRQHGSGAAGGGEPARAPAAPPAAALTFTGAQTPYSVTVTGSHNSYLYGEHRKRLRPLDVALSGGDPDAPPELVPLGFRPGAVVRNGRLQPGAGWGAWNAESQLALNALGSVSQAQFRAAARKRAPAATAWSSPASAPPATPSAAASPPPPPSAASAVREEELPPLMNGLNTPVLVLSGGLTSTPIHVEDLALSALNSNVGPAAKVWDVARLDRVGRDPVIAAMLAGGAGGSAAAHGGAGGGLDLLYRLRSKQDFRDLLELGLEAGWGEGAVLSIVQQPGMRVVTTPGYVWHNTVSAGAGVALSTNWMELPEAPAGAWRAHFDAALEDMYDYATRVEYDRHKMGWMAGALQLLDGALGSAVRAHLSDGALGNLAALQAAMVPDSATGRQKRQKRRR